MDNEKLIKSTQEQAVASWVDYLNKVRFDRLIEALSKQDVNLKSVMESIDNAFSSIKEDIIFRNRGGDKGMHGFIAEVAECGIGNARQRIVGNPDVYIWINDNGPDDFIRGLETIQQKFVQDGGNLSLRAIEQHLKLYPKYLEAGYKYQIPKDYYDKIMEYLEIPEELANKLPTSTGEFSLRQWKLVHDFFKTNNIDPDKLEPSILEYKEVQKGVIAETFQNEKEHLKKVDQKQRDIAHQKSKPSLAEGTKTTVVAAVSEGATTFITAVIRKRKEGKKINEFNQEDWIEITGDTAKGTIKGGIRGVSIYTLTNFTQTPAAVATAVTTAAFGVAEQAYLFRKGTIDEIQFIENAEILCLDASVSALSSLIGQAMIPVPVIGAIIGNAVGTMMYQIAKDSLSEKEQEIIKKHLAELEELDQKLAIEYHQLVEQMNIRFAEYMEIISAAFDPNIEEALDGSVKLAKYMGVPYSEVLDSYDKIASYFLD